VANQLELNAVSVAYGRKIAVDRVSLSLAPGQIGCLLGPSGCGKTTLLRAIAGFEPLAQGEIHLHGKPVSRPGNQIAPERRRVGMVFQDFALFPHLNIEKNIAFGLRRLPITERRQRVAELLTLTGLERVGAVYPHQLSGGQQQRVALARAMAPRPEILLLDEPFSSLDVDLREQLAGEVRGLLKRDGITAILVTHDQLEAFAMSDLIGVIHQGRLQQWDTAYRLYHNPANRFVADFIGQGTILDAKVMDSDRLATPLGEINGAVPEGCRADCPVNILLRPDDIILTEESSLRGTVLKKAFRGSEYLYTLKLADGSQILSLMPSHHDITLGSETGLRLDIRHLVVFRPDQKESAAESNGG
jgi:iron(III) transport system ATP-binding protein